MLLLLPPATRVVLLNRELLQEHIQASAAELLDVTREQSRRGRSAAALRSGGMPSVADVPDVAAALFTSQHRAVKLAGKRGLRAAPAGTGSVRLAPSSAAVSGVYNT